MQDLYKKWMNGEVFSFKGKNFVPEVKLVGELSLYKHLNDEEEAEIRSTSEIIEIIENIKDKFDTIALHFGYQFNADYDSVLALIGFIHRRFNGKILTSSPEEIVFLSIRGGRTIEEVLEDLKKMGVQNILGYVTPSIVNSPFYSDEDELMLDDRHHIYEIILKMGFSIDYPFNLGQIETEDEFEEMKNFAKNNTFSSIILQPNPLIDTNEKFDYLRGQKLFLSLFENGEVPFYRTNELLTKNAGNYFVSVFDEIREIDGILLKK
jgi:hypothetical protein